MLLKEVDEEVEQDMKDNPVIFNLIIEMCQNTTSTLTFE